MNCNSHFEIGLPQFLKSFKKTKKPILVTIYLQEFFLMREKNRKWLSIKF